jgi:hypothetical protein
LEKTHHCSGIKHKKNIKGNKEIEDLARVTAVYKKRALKFPSSCDELSGVNGQGNTLFLVTQGFHLFQLSIGRPTQEAVFPAITVQPRSV